MKRKVKLTNTAKSQLKNLLEYLEEAWPEKVKRNFVKKLDKRIEMVSSNPNLFPRSFIKEGLHKCVVTK
jgi:plasmid stabilization system protein ParE